MLHNEKFRYRVLLLVRGNKDALVLFLYVCFPHRIRKEDRTMKHPVMLANMPDGRSIAGWSVFWCHMDTELFCRASCRSWVKFEMPDSHPLALPFPWNYRHVRKVKARLRDNASRLLLAAG